MKRREFALAALAAISCPAFAAASEERFGRGLLWRVEKPGTTPSHVYGTIHVVDPRVAALPPEVRSRFDAARSLMLEFVPDAYSRERLIEAATLPDRQTLEEKIGPRDFERAVELLQKAGLAREAVNRLKPWGVMLSLREPPRGTGLPLDGQLLALAHERRLPLSQLEEVEEQIFTFDELPMASQVALLKHNLEHRAELAQLAERTLEAYLQGDLAAIWRLREAFIARHPQVAAHQAAMTKRVVHDRSVVMAFRMQRQLRRGGAFVAVSALHLYGDKGVLALLEGDGYRAEKVY